MAYSKHYVDGVLLNWGDRLFYEPLCRRRAPRVSRVRWPNDAARLREQLDRTVRRVPEVMVKITNKGGSRHGMAAIRRHLQYISRNGEVELEDQDGQIIVGRDALGDLAEQWRYGGRGIPAESRHRETFNVLLSMPPGTDRQAVRDAARAFAKTLFAPNHPYVFAAHEDEAHPHVHLSVQARGRDGRRLNPRKADLQRWREVFAQQLREHGVDANATPRRTRGVTRHYPQQAVIHMRARGEIPEYDRRSVTEAQQRAAINAHEVALDAWRNIGRAMAASDNPEDRSMSVEVTDFVRDMPVVEQMRTPSRTRGTKHPDSEKSKSGPGAQRGQSPSPSTPSDEPDVER